MACIWREQGREEEVCGIQTDLRGGSTTRSFWKIACTGKSNGGAQNVFIRSGVLTQNNCWLLGRMYIGQEEWHRQKAPKVDLTNLQGGSTQSNVLRPRQSLPGDAYRIIQHLETCKPDE